MKHVLKSGAAALAATTLVLAAAGAANAETDRVNDRTGDVWRTPVSETGSISKGGSTLNGDIDKTVVDHGTDTLTVTTTYARMAKRKVTFQPYYVIRTDTGAEYEAGAFAGPRMWGGEHIFYDPSAARMAPRLLRGVAPTGEEPCPGMTHRFDYGQDTVEVEIPRTCLGDASWVKVKSLAISARRTSERLWIDNGHIRGHAFRGWTGRVHADPAPVD